MPLFVFECSNSDFKRAEMFQIISHFLLIVFLVVLLEANLFTAEGIYNEGDVVIGALFKVREKNSDNTCGVISPRGIAYVEAMLYAIDKINNDPSILKNVTLGYDIKDACNNPALANSFAFEFVTRNDALKLKYEVNDTTESFEKYFGVLSKPIAAVIGTGDSSSSVIVANLFNIGDIPQVSPFATSEELSLPYFKTFFRPVPPDGQQAKALADVVDYFKWKYVYVVGADTSYGRYGVLALEKEAQERSTFCIARTYYFPRSGYQQKLQAIVSEIKQVHNIKVIVLWGGPTTVINFIEEATRQEITGKTVLAPEAWSGVTALFQPKYMNFIGGFFGTKLRDYNLDGFVHHLVTLNYSSRRVQSHDWWIEYWMTEQKCPSKKSCNFQNFQIDKKRYDEMYTSYLSYIIDAVYVAAHALNGIYRCPETNSIACPKTEPFIDTKDILRYMSNVTFKGITGKVQFDKNKESISSAAYDIVNLHAGENGPELKIVGKWDRSEKVRLKIDNSSLYWNNGSKLIPRSVCKEPCPPGYFQTAPVACCWKCVRCPQGLISQTYSSPNCTECPKDKMPNSDQNKCIDLPEVNVSFYDSQSIVLLAVAGVELILVLFMFGIGIKYRNTPIVKSSNREMSVLFLIGIVIGIVAGIILLARPTTTICYFTNPLHALYYTLCLSILLVKTNRLVQIFEFSFVSSKIGQLCNSKNSQFVILFLLNGIAIVLVVLWHVLDPPYVHITIERLKSKHLGCKGHRETLGIALQASLYAYQLALSIFCAYYAFKARNLPENFSEARYIAFAMYMQLLCTICYATLQNSVEGNFRTTSSSAIIVISSFGFLVCMFAPKTYIILKFPEKNTPEYIKTLVANHSMERSFVQVNVKSSKESAKTGVKAKEQRERLNSSIPTNSIDGMGKETRRTKSVSSHIIVEKSRESNKALTDDVVGTNECNSNPNVAVERNLNKNNSSVAKDKDFNSVAKVTCSNTNTCRKETESYNERNTIDDKETRTNIPRSVTQNMSCDNPVSVGNGTKIPYCVFNDTNHNNPGDAVKETESTDDSYEPDETHL